MLHSVAQAACPALRRQGRRPPLQGRSHLRRMSMFALTQEQLALQARARELAQSDVKARAAEVDRTEQYPWDNVERLKEAGFLGMTIPRDYGGQGLGWL